MQYLELKVSFEQRSMKIVYLVLEFPWLSKIQVFLSPKSPALTLYCFPSLLNPLNITLRVWCGVQATLKNNFVSCLPAG